MTKIYRRFAPGEDIPVLQQLQRRKLFKFYGRESMAAVFTALLLSKECNLDALTPFYYSGGMLENLDFQKQIRRPLPGESVHKVLMELSPASSFRLMRNMAPAFVSMELGLKGDDAVVIDSAQALLYAAVTAPGDAPVLIGTACVHEDGSAEAGFALGTRQEFLSHPLFGREAPAIDLFRPCQL